MPFKTKFDKTHIWYETHIFGAFCGKTEGGLSGKVEIHILDHFEQKSQNGFQV